MHAANTLVIGGGPAGAACALWLHQLGCQVLLVEASSRLGGLQKSSPYVNRWFPSVQDLEGQQIAANLQAHLQAAEVPMRLNARVRQVQLRTGSVDVEFGDGTADSYQFLVLATGARFRSGGFTPTAQLSIGPGHSFEAIDVAGKRVAVLGGGDNAFDAHCFAMARGASHAQIFARRVRAQLINQRRVAPGCVSVGPFSVDQEAMTVNGERFDVISVQFGFEAVLPDGLDALERTPEAGIRADHWGQTSLAGIYAIGEVANTFHPCTVTSMAHGIQAAKHIQRCIEG